MMPFACLPTSVAQCLVSTATGARAPVRPACAARLIHRRMACSSDRASGGGGDGGCKGAAHAPRHVLTSDFLSFAPEPGVATCLVLLNHTLPAMTAKLWASGEAGLAQLSGRAGGGRRWKICFKGRPGSAAGGSGEAGREDRSSVDVLPPRAALAFGRTRRSPIATLSWLPPVPPVLPELRSLVPDMCRWRFKPAVRYPARNARTGGDRRPRTSSAGGVETRLC
eukprot:366283-Chlamydomonas_euryale.AAC.3